MIRLRSLCLIGHLYIYHPIIKSTPGATIFGRNMSFDNSYTATLPGNKIECRRQQQLTSTNTPQQQQKKKKKGKGLTLLHKCTVMVPLERKETLYERIKIIKKIDTLHWES